jgi:hypothetical protein
MSFTKETATATAKADLAKRLALDELAIKVISAEDKDFPNSSLGAPVDDEMSSQMIVSGWEIILGADHDTYEYRADTFQVRLVNFKGENIIVAS